MTDDEQPATREESERPEIGRDDHRRAQWSEWSRTLSVAVLTAAVTLTSSWFASQNSLRQGELQTRSERDATIRAERRDAYSQLLADLNAFRPSMEGCWELQFPPTDWNPEADVYPTLEAALQDLGAVQLVGTPESAALATDAYYDAQFLAEECDRVRLSVAEEPGSGSVDGPLSESWEAIMVAFDLQQTSAVLMSEVFRSDLLGASDDATVAQLKSDVEAMREQLEAIYPRGEEAED